MGNGFKKACYSAANRIVTEKRMRKKLFMSIVSLILSFVVLVSMTFSWFSIKTSQLDANNFQLDCGKGLRVNDTGTSQLSFSTVEKYLIPASSVDGRNIYFPTDGSDFSNTTELMTFRCANAGDKNQNYIQIDFTLTAQQNHTALYINEENTSIRIADKKPNPNDPHIESDWSITKAAPLRAALWSSTTESGTPNIPIVFNPTTSTLRTAAVEDVDRSTGAYISSGRQVAHAFSEYSFGGTPVATLEKGIETKFSYIIWLEGTDSKCKDRILNKDIEIKLSFTTSWDKTQTIRFKDETSNGKVTGLMNEGYTLSLHYEEDVPAGQTATNMDFNMYRYNENDDNIWSCNIPGDMKNKISFILRPNVPNRTTYSFVVDRNNNSTLNRGANRLYVAEMVDTDNSTCYGHWVALGDSDGTGHDGGDLDGDDF